MNDENKRYKLGQIKSKISTARQDKSLQTHRDVLFVDCVPRSTKRKFKAACAAKGKKGESMRDAVIRLLRFYVANGGIIPGQEAGDEDNE
jgi:hypothetical protein